MRRLITYLNALLLGVILGMILLAIVHAFSPHRPEEAHSKSAYQQAIALRN